MKRPPTYSFSLIISGKGGGLLEIESSTTKGILIQAVDMPSLTTHLLFYIAMVRLGEEREYGYNVW